MKSTKLNKNELNVLVAVVDQIASYNFAMSNIEEYVEHMLTPKQIDLLREKLGYQLTEVSK
jgi:hypothetical protein